MDVSLKPLSCFSDDISRIFGIFFFFLLWELSTEAHSTSISQRIHWLKSAQFSAFSISPQYFILIVKLFLPVSVI